MPVFSEPAGLVMDPMVNLETSASRHLRRRMVLCAAGAMAQMLLSTSASAGGSIQKQQAALDQYRSGVAEGLSSIEVPTETTVRVVVRAFEAAAIGSEINARITYLPAREGDSFKKGDVLVTFDCRRSEAEHEAAEASMKELETAYNSQVKLLEYKSTGTASVEQALHQYEKAQAELRLAKVRLESCRIVAPFDGIVTEKTVQVHEIAQPNQPLIKILNQSKIELVMMVPSDWLPQITGSEFNVKIDETSEIHQARVLQSTGLIDPVSQTSRVIAEITDGAKGVLPGMSGTADFAAVRTAR